MCCVLFSEYFLFVLLAVGLSGETVRRAPSLGVTRRAVRPRRPATPGTSTASARGTRAAPRTRRTPLATRRPAQVPDQAQAQNNPLGPEPITRTTAAAGPGPSISFSITPAEAATTTTRCVTLAIPLWNWNERPRVPKSPTHNAHSQKKKKKHPANFSAENTSFVHTHQKEYPQQECTLTFDATFWSRKCRLNMHDCQKLVCV